MSVLDDPECFKVAFSLAGEDGEVVRPIAEALKARLGEDAVFYYEWFDGYLAGADGDLKLQKIYANPNMLVVLCVSGNYNKAWTRLEWEVIRDRIRDARQQGERARQGVMPIRVGEGQIEGMPGNTFTAEVRLGPVAQSADKILRRLHDFRPDLGLTGDSRLQKPIAGAGFSPDLPTCHWNIANHKPARDAFAQLLLVDPPFQLLPIKGASQLGKTNLTREMLHNAQQLDGLHCARLELKGSNDLKAELDAVALALELPLPTGDSDTQRLGGMLQALRRRAEATLLILDAWERAGELGEWIKDHLLPALLHAPWLRIVVAGQTCPSLSGPIQRKASPLQTLSMPPAADWLEFGQRNGHPLTLELVETLCGLPTASPALLAQMLGSGER